MSIRSTKDQRPEPGKLTRNRLRRTQSATAPGATHRRGGLGSDAAAQFVALQTNTFIVVGHALAACQVPELPEFTLWLLFQRPLLTIELGAEHAPRTKQRYSHRA